jgi:hypothetical protein
MQFAPQSDPTKNSIENLQRFPVESVSRGDTKMRKERRLLAGDRVRLNRNIAEDLMRKDKRQRVDWLKRRGVVIRVSAPSDSATIKWDDRITTDFWPTRALKKAL